MASQQPNAWQTAGRQRQSNSSSRTPNRSGTASPNQQNPSQPPRQEPARTQPANNAWTQRNSGTGPSNGQPRVSETSQGSAEQSVNSFNTAQVKAFLGRDVGLEAYKPAGGSSSPRASGGAWGIKPNPPSHMANNQPFFLILARQVAALEGGG